MTRALTDCYARPLQQQFVAAVWQVCGTTSGAISLHRVARDTAIAQHQYIADACMTYHQLIAGVTRYHDISHRMFGFFYSYTIAVSTSPDYLLSLSLFLSLYVMHDFCSEVR